MPNFSKYTDMYVNRYRDKSIFKNIYWGYFYSGCCLHLKFQFFLSYHYHTLQGLNLFLPTNLLCNVYILKLKEHCTLLHKPYATSTTTIDKLANVEITYWDISQIYYKYCTNIVSWILVHLCFFFWNLKCLKKH